MSDLPIPRRGEIWWLNFSPTKGREQRGDRPALIIAVDRSNASPAELTIAIPMTSTHGRVRFFRDEETEQSRIAPSYPRRV